MIKESLKIVIKEFHESELPSLIVRKEPFDFSVLHSPVKRIVTITGPRRAGKTYLLFQIMKYLLKRTGVSLTDFLYMNLEDERILPMNGEDLQYVLDAYLELYEKETVPFVFLDGILNIPGWEQFLRMLNDRGIRAVITGSNSRGLAREIATSLRGRTLSYEILPFSFGEFLAAKGIGAGEDIQFDKERHRIRKSYEEYLFSGGYPEVTLAKDQSTRGRIVQDYYSAVFYKDLVEPYRIKNTALLKQWLNTLVINVSSLIGFTKVEGDFKSRGMKLSRATLSYFAQYVEDAYFGFFVKMYSESIRKRQVNPKKFYLVDVAFHNYLTFRFSENRGRLLENIVFLELRRRGFPVFYYKTAGGHEIDFLIRELGTWKLIQVCHDLDHIDTFSREKESLLAGLHELDMDSGTILTDHERRTESVRKYTINIIPVWEWLLNPGEI